MLRDERRGGVLLEGLEEVRQVAGVRDIVAGVEFDRIVLRADQSAAGGEDDVFDDPGICGSDFRPGPGEATIRYRSRRAFGGLDATSVAL